METEVIEVLPLDRLAKIYRKMRSAIEALTKEYDTQVEAIKEQQEGVKNAMKDQMKALGVTSVKTAEGTVILSVKTRYNTQDWDSFIRIAQSNMAQFLTENPGLVPPGLNTSSEYDVSVRKPT